MGRVFWMAMVAGCWPGPLPDCVSCLLNDDIDQDGVSANEGDCDDADPRVGPYATEVCNNDIDDDCDGSADPCVRTGVRPLQEADALVASSIGNAFAGTQVVNMGDVDGDGSDDVAVGAPGRDLSGAVYRLDGRAAWMDAALETAAPRPILGPPLGSMGTQLAASPGLLIARAGVLFDTPGALLYAVDPTFPDFPDDAGIPGDVWVGQQGGDFGSHVALGPAGQLLASSNAGRTAWWLTDIPGGGGNIDSAGAVPITGPRATALAVADFNGDGVQDLAIGATSASNALLAFNVGAVYLLFGPVTSTVDLADADVTLWGAEAGDRAGGALAVLPDLDGDGAVELAVGAPAGPGETAWILSHPFEGDTLDEAAWLRLAGARDTGLGTAFAAVDLNRDGELELAVSAPNDDVAGEGAGVVHVLQGPFSPGFRDAENASLTLLGEGAGHGAGTSLAAADADGDGYADLLVGAPGESTRADNGGGVHVWLSRGL